MRIITSKNLNIIACDQLILEAAIKGNNELSVCIDAIVPENWSQFGARALQYSLDKLKSSENEKGWWSYLPIHKNNNTLIGLCGFKGQPNENGQVEIGYEIKEEYRNKGLATELANSLIDHAFNFENINMILAHTLGETNASTKVLSNCGFEKTEDIDGKDLGILWKWELKRN